MPTGRNNLWKVIMMVRQEQTMAVEMREAMRGGAGSVQLRHLFAGDELGPHSRMCARVTLPKGASIGAHDHTAEREIYYILKGSARFEENGVVSILQAGDATITGGGGVHSIANAGDEPLEFMAVIILD